MSDKPGAYHFASPRWGVQSGLALCGETVPVTGDDYLTTEPANFGDLPCHRHCRRCLVILAAHFVAGEERG